MAIQIQLQSINYNGQLADITFYPCSGGIISLGYQTIPYTYTNDNYEGTYDLFFSAFNQTCQLVITCPTPTPTPSPTSTLTPTPTQTNTPSLTPTGTNNPLCPQQFVISNSTNQVSISDGTYNRLTIKDPNISFNACYQTGLGAGSVIILGAAPDGKQYASFGFTDGTNYYQYVWNSTLGRWGATRTTINYLINGGTVNGNYFPITDTTSLFDGTIYYPTSGQKGDSVGYYLSYSISCPTPTPTTTTTLTPTTTPTTTPTPTPSTPAFDTDAQAFFNRVTAAGGTLSNLEKTATNQLVLDMKANSIWGIPKAVYPMVGGSAASCAQNLMSSGFTGTFNGGWTISSTGVLGNGTNTYIDSQLSPVSELGLNSTHIGFYSRTNYEATGGVMIDIASTSLLYIVGWGFVDAYHANNSPEGNSGYAQPTNSLGFIINNRNSSTAMSAWRQGVQYTDTTSSAAFSSSQPSPTIYLGAYNSGSSALYNTVREYAFFTIGLGLSDTNASAYSTIVQTFQTTLGRQV